MSSKKVKARVANIGSNLGSSTSVTVSAPSRTYGYGRIKRKGSSIRLSKSFRKGVQKVINENAEDKYAFKTITNVNYNSGIDNVGDLNFILPNITNGTTDNARIGDQLKAHTMKLRGHIISNMTYNTYSQARIGVRMLIVQPKLYTSQSAIQANAATWLAMLLKKGGSVSGFTGVVSDLYAPVNNDAITTYYDRVYYMKSPYVLTAVGDVNTSGTTKFFAINLRVKNKKLMYDSSENSGLTPVNYNPVLLVGYAKLDSATPDTVLTQVNLNWDSMLTYQDM